MTDYSDRPTVIVNVSDDDAPSITFEGFEGSPRPRAVLRDWSRGNVPDQHGDLYVDEVIQDAE